MVKGHQLQIRGQRSVSHRFGFLAIALVAILLPVMSFQSVASAATSGAKNPQKPKADAMSTKPAKTMFPATGYFSVARSTAVGSS